MRKLKFQGILHLREEQHPGVCGSKSLAAKSLRTPTATNELISIKLLQHDEMWRHHTGAIVTLLNNEEGNSFLLSGASLVNSN